MKTLTPEDVRKWIDAGADVCPFCGGTDVDYDLPEVDGGGVYQKAWCKVCGAAWHEGHTLDHLLPEDEKGEIGESVYAAEEKERDE